MVRQVIFDTETTGFSPQDGDRLIEIGAIEMIDGNLTGESFHRYVNPERDVPMEAYRVHRISTEMLQDKPLFRDPSVGEAFLAFIEGAELIAHNAPFDVGFINAELDIAGLPALTNKVIDTVPMARRKFPGAPASLDALCQRFGISKAERDEKGHGALLDAELLARVYIELTGGRQASFLSASTSSRSAPGDAGGDRAVTYQRPRPLPPRITDEERAAHRAFIEELGTPIWAKLQG
ncbi:DNA polymerase III subunit epsilon [Parvularcula lutaonensis]|uniref:DNA polymerase III subunit epsilon n=1 Tax=Parvularcula lutaonensis TaxID=491923 RepID=A0ABV7MCC6_9PROT|nr:DNA polymerase III subunit epsilon [Parvularcula lutaonensis]GGY46529.1 DNA polymerase III subunit epsilon [Parvularcula lutaonensis]